MGLKDRGMPLNRSRQIGEDDAALGKSGIHLSQSRAARADDKQPGVFFPSQWLPQLGVDGQIVAGPEEDLSCREAADIGPAPGLFFDGRHRTGLKGLPSAQPSRGQFRRFPKILRRPADVGLAESEA
jgi:hypothetical protein